ncbi:MAG: L,D-transpeptidase family protein [Methylacidiphilales bacterium]|nr:L,D-transpeptidase family protein [Candidatus Methylacidiphilales bacterium]
MKFSKFLIKYTAGLVLLIFLCVLVWANQSDTGPPPTEKVDRILIEKEKRKLTLIKNGTVLKVYHISLGRNPLEPKEREGDHKTPEGLYRIVEHKEKSSCYRALRVSYPEDRDLAKAKALGINPGSNIMIHGLVNGTGLFGKLHRLMDWTSGCIAVTDWEIDEISNATPDGTLVEIRP